MATRSYIRTKKKKIFVTHLSAYVTFILRTADSLHRSSFVRNYAHATLYTSDDGTRARNGGVAFIHAVSNTAGEVLRTFMKIDFKVPSLLYPEITHCYENSLLRNIKPLYSKSLLCESRAAPILSLTMTLTPFSYIQVQYSWCTRRNVVMSDYVPRTFVIRRNDNCISYTYSSYWLFNVATLSEVSVKVKLSDNIFNGKLSTVVKPSDLYWTVSINPQTFLEVFPNVCSVRCVRYFLSVFQWKTIQILAKGIKLMLIFDSTSYLHATIEVLLSNTWIYRLFAETLTRRRFSAV